VASPATLVTLGSLRDKETLLAVFGLGLTSALMAWGLRGAMLLGIAGTTLAGVALGLVKWNWSMYRVSDILATAGKLGVKSALHIGLLEIVFVFLFVDLFDNLGTLVGVGKKAGLFDEANRIPRLNSILLCDATATIVGSFAGTSTVTSYIESAAGVAAGGRTGLTSVTVGVLFLLTLFAAPLVTRIPTAATAPALILVGALMVGAVSEVDWSDAKLAVPAFLTLVTIPLTYSIANGLAFGVTAYAVLQLVTGAARPRDWLMYVLAALFVARFAWIAKG
jgi:adenine/guanine/hypoxanthine permease